MGEIVTNLLVCYGFDQFLLDVVISSIIFRNNRVIEYFMHQNQSCYCYSNYSFQIYLFSVETRNHYCLSELALYYEMKMYLTFELQSLVSLHPSRFDLLRICFDVRKFYSFGFVDVVEKEERYLALEVSSIHLWKMICSFAQLILEQYLYCCWYSYACCNCGCLESENSKLRISESQNYDEGGTQCLPFVSNHTFCLKVQTNRILSCYLHVPGSKFDRIYLLSRKMIKRILFVL